MSSLSAGLVRAIDAEHAAQGVQFVHHALELLDAVRLDCDLNQNTRVVLLIGAQANHVDPFVSDDGGDVAHEPDAVPALFSGSGRALSSEM